MFSTGLHNRLASDDTGRSPYPPYRPPRPDSPPCRLHRDGGLHYYQGREGEKAYHLPSGTCEEWAYFLLRWSDYKAATHLAGPDVIYQLLECCDDGLRKDLSRIFGALASQDEPTVLSHIKTLAVRRENIMVFRVNYSRCGRTEMNLYGHLLPASMAKQASASTRSLVPAIMMWTIVLPWCEIP